MSDINNIHESPKMVNTGVQSPKTDNSKEDQKIQDLLVLTLKHVYVGPRKRTKSSKRNPLDLALASQKVMFNNDLTVSRKNEEPKDSHQDSDTAEVIVPRTVIRLIPNDRVNPKSVICFFEAFKKLYNNRPGSPEYVKKMNSYDASRNEFYRINGINIPERITKQNRPILTLEQKTAYNETVGQYSFSYYQLQVSFREPGKKAIRSKTYRLLTKPDLEDVAKKIRHLASQWNEVFDVKTKQPSN